MQQKIKWKYQIGDHIIDYRNDNSIIRDLTIIDKETRIKITQKTDSQSGYSNKTEKWYKYHCNICGWNDGWILEHNLQKLTNCSCCSSVVKVPGINTFNDKHPELMQYLKNIHDGFLYTSGDCKHKLETICPECHDEYAYTVSKLSERGFKCRKCGDDISYPEKFFIALLNQLNVDYIYQLSKINFNWCGDYRYDFYLMKYKCIIEVHGMQHYQDKNYYGSTLKERQKIDKDKYELALNNDIENYIVIDARYSDKDYIKNSIVHSNLSQILDLNNIDYDLCDNFTTTSLLRAVCSYWNKHTDMSTTEIGKYFNLNQTTIKNYLKKGCRLGFCCYNADIQRTKIKKRNKMNLDIISEAIKYYQNNMSMNDICKTLPICKETLRKYLILNNIEINNDQRSDVEVYLNNELILTYHGIAELCENSKELLGIEGLNRHSITRVCRGERKTYKGFVFKYATKEFN